METNNRTKCYYTDEEIAILEQEHAKHRPFYEIIKLQMNELSIDENAAIRSLSNNKYLAAKLFTLFRTNEKVPTLEHKDFLNLLAISDQELAEFTADDAAWKLAKKALDFAISYKPGVNPVFEVEKTMSAFAFLKELKFQFPLPEQFDLSENESFEYLRQLITNHYTENNGEIELWGKILYYELYRPFDTKDTCLRFDINGKQMEI
ncbi:MAG: hypothetical protein KA206_11365 [Paludibacter sp.]|jgi:hypothetical protein|nr:hypothetical protein [Paludibacter sp.]